MTEKARDFKISTRFNKILLILIPTFSYVFSKYIVPSIWKDFSLGNYASLYTYSALVQAFAALFALVGMFVIFRLQSIDNRISNYERMITEYIGKVVMIHGLYSSILDLKVIASNPPEHLDVETKKKLKEIDKEESWHQTFNMIEELQNRKLKVKVKFLKPLLLTAGVMVFAIMLLPLSQNLHNNPSRELFWILSIIFFAIWGVIEMSVYVISALRP